MGGARSLFAAAEDAPPVTLRLLVVASETPDQQDARRARTGQASHETYADTLRGLRAGCIVEHASCVDGSGPVPPDRLRRLDGVLFAGSPIQMHEAGPETRAAAAFMGAVFEAGTPSFGSCAGLQIAAVAAGGSTRPRGGAMEAGFARGVTATPEGRAHPLLRGRPAAWDAPAMHSSVVDRLPQGATVLARAEGTPVEAAEIRHARGIFWGVQYHPELGLGEIAEALRRQAKELIAQDVVEDRDALEARAGALEALARAPDRRDLAARLGLDEEVLDPARRTREIANFLDRVAGRRVAGTAA